MLTLDGTVDHFNPDRSLAYEWNNYRYASGLMNCCKSKSTRILDPFAVQEGWFRVLIPSLQLIVLKDRIPAELYELAEETVRRLHLKDDERIIRWRKAWYDMYLEGKINLPGLRQVAPLIAAAIDEQN
jgi:hypothetical protein